MKNKIEAEIRSIATDILNAKNSRSTEEWKKTILAIYEKLCVLDYLEKQLQTSDEETLITSEEIPTEDTPIEPITETSDSEIFKDSIPIIEEEIETIEEQIEEKIKIEVQESVSVSIEKEVPTPIQEGPKRVADELQRFASTYKQTPVFGRKQSETTDEVQNTNNAQAANKPKSLNDSLNRGLHIALNDRIAFINNLFAGSTQDFNRVLSQINSMEDLESIQNFLNYQIKPDYQNWEGKEEYSERFIMIIEKKFS